MMNFPALKRQREIYLKGFAGSYPSVPVSFSKLEEAAKAAMSPHAYAYIAGGAGNESTMRANRGAFEKIKIIPRMLRDVSVRDTSIALFGQKLPSPFLLCPIGVLEIVNKEADVAVAKAAASVNVPFIFLLRLRSQWKKPQVRWVKAHGGFNYIGVSQMNWLQVLWSGQSVVIAQRLW